MAARARVGHAVELAGHLAGQQPARHRRLGGEQRERLLAADALAAGHAEHRAAVAQVAHERARVEARERDDAGAAQPVEQALATVRLVVARLVADQRRRLHAARLRGGVLDAVVADHGRREREQLPGVARIRERFLVARHRRREDGLADRGAGRADAHAGPGRAVLEVEADLAHAATRAAAACATRPPASVSRQRPCTSRPRKAQLRLRERRSSSLTVQRSRRSQSARSATAPTAMRGARQPEGARGAGGHALHDQLQRHDAALDQAEHERREAPSRGRSRRSARPGTAPPSRPGDAVRGRSRCSRSCRRAGPRSAPAGAARPPAAGSS